MCTMPITENSPPPILKSIRIGQHSISYQDVGRSDAPVALLMSGWCHDHRLFDQLLPHLAHDLRVLVVDWRGHGEDRTPVGDFGYLDQTSDVLAVLDELNVEQFFPVSHSHGGWVNLEILDRVGAARAPRSVVIDWIMTPPTVDFAESLAAIQDPDNWREGRQRLYDVWLNGHEHERVVRHLEVEMSGFGYEMWARSCKVIAGAYERFGSPLQRMAGVSESRPIMHLFSQPTASGYLKAQHDFKADHPWFDYKLLGGPTHFPTLDSPERVAEEILSFIHRSDL